MKVDELRFSLFYDVSKGIYTTEPIQESVKFNRIIKIYNSEVVRRLSSALIYANEEQKKQLKKQLPFFTPLGTFSPTRTNENMTSFNDSLICLDIDNLEKNELTEIKKIIRENYSTLLCAVSPRGRGLKALILIDNTINRESCYNTLKLNLNTISDKLGLIRYTDKIDVAQFKPTQPCFISYDPTMYINTKCTPLNINLLPYIEPLFERATVDYEEINKIRQSTNYLEPINYRMKRYFDNSVDSLVKFFALCDTGNRHANIIKVQTISSWIHYAPQIESEVKSILLNACIGMYGTENEARNNNVIQSFNRAWNSAPNRRNDTLENILNDSKYSHTKQKTL